MADSFYSKLGLPNTFIADQYFKSGRPWFDVIAFGADPTGAADSTTAIQTAINTALGLRTDTGVSMSGFTVTDPAAVAGDVGKYVNSPNYATITSYPVGVTASNATMQITGVASAAFVANQPVVLTAATAPTGFTAGTTYFILSPSLVSTTFSFSLSATSGGAAITPSSTGTTVAVQQVTGGCSLIAAVTPGTGYTVTTPAVASLSGQVVAIGTGSSVSGRNSAGPVFLPAGSYKVTRDLLVQSSGGFRFAGAGSNNTTLIASGAAFTTAVLNIDGSLDGYYGALQFRGDGTEGTGGVSGSGVPNAVNLTFTTSASRSTSANTLFNIRLRNLKFVSGVSAAGIMTRQLDGTVLQDIVVTGSQPQGGWSAAARTDTGLCGTSTGTPTTVTDTAAASGDLGMLISGPGIPAGTKILAVTPTVGYTISQNVTATASGVTFIVGTGLWQAAFVFGNGAIGNIYDHVAYACSAAGCFYGYYCNSSSIGLFGAQPAINSIDFWLAPIAQVTVENVQSQASGQFIVCPGNTTSPISFRDCTFKGNTGLNYNNVWITTGTSYGNWVLENLVYEGSLTSPHPVMDLDSADYNAGFTLISIAQPNPPTTGIVPGGTSTVIAINYQDTTAGPGPASTLYPFYAVNAGMLFQKDTAANRANYQGAGETFFWATDTAVLSHWNGTAWTALAPAGSVTAPDIQFFTSGGTWTRPAGAVTTFVSLLAGGSGAGSGRQGAAATVRCGGGGGGGGQFVQRQFVSADLTSTVAVTVGTGGTGGAAQATPSTNGNNGSAGTLSSFGPFMFAQAGTAGAGGSATAGAGGAGGTPYSAATGEGSGAPASATGGVGAAVNPTERAAPGGSSGGGITSADVPGNGQFGSTNMYGGSGASTRGNGGTVDTTPPTSGTVPPAKGTPAGSPGSGAASITTAAQAGANANFGAGGSGGGASLNGNNSGAGGNGGGGFALVITYFQ